jgi:hypothetical protein
MIRSHNLKLGNPVIRDDLSIVPITNFRRQAKFLAIVTIQRLLPPNVEVMTVECRKRRAGGKESWQPKNLM